jgi:hypothetical protein
MCSALCLEISREGGERFWTVDVQRNRASWLEYRLDFLPSLYPAARVISAIHCDHRGHRLQLSASDQGVYAAAFYLNGTTCVLSFIT